MDVPDSFFGHYKIPLILLLFWLVLEDYQIFIRLSQPPIKITIWFLASLTCSCRMDFERLIIMDWCVVSDDC